MRYWSVITTGILLTLAWGLFRFELVSNPTSRDEALVVALFATISMLCLVCEGAWSKYWGLKAKHEALVTFIQCGWSLEERQKQLDHILDVHAEDVRPKALQLNAIESEEISGANKEMERVKAMASFRFAEKTFDELYEQLSLIRADFFTLEMGLRDWRKRKPIDHNRREPVAS